MVVLACTDRNQGRRRRRRRSFSHTHHTNLPSTAVDTIIKRMAEHRVLGDKRLVQALPLHSSLTSEQQSGVFRRMPRGATKIVVSTNIAETSITVRAGRRGDVSMCRPTRRMRQPPEPPFITTSANQPTNRPTTALPHRSTTFPSWWTRAG